MWLLKLHIAISILCLITYKGFKTVFRELLKENGYLTPDSEKKKKLGWWIFFVPILNVGVVTLLLVMLTMPKAELMEWCEQHKKEGRKIK